MNTTTIPNIEIARVGTYKLSTGVHHFTRGQLAAAVEHASQPGATAPRLGIGHIDRRFDGEPAIGRVRNLRLAEDGDVLLGDYTDVPEWLAKSLATAYPGRSLEASVAGDALKITAVKLLGLTLPGISSLKDLEHRFSDSGPLAIAAGEDADGRHIEIVIASTEEAAQKVGELVDANQAESRPDTTSKEESFMDPKEIRKDLGLAEDASDADVKSKLAELKARPEATGDVVPLAEHQEKVELAVAAAREEERSKIAASREGEVTLDKATHERLLAAAQLAEDLNAKTIAASRDSIVEDAARLGKIEPSRKDYWRQQLDDDTEHATKRLTASVADGGLAPFSAVPVSEIGASGGLQDHTDDPHDGGTGLFAFATKED
jgi:hypothetical protein